MKLVLELATALRAVGGQPYLVGGAVRDRLLGRTPKDLDLEVYGLRAETVRAVCRRVGVVNEVGLSFAVLNVTRDGETVDVSLPRRETATGRGHRDFAVATDPFMTPQDACRRRDFTVNAILMDPLTGALLDPVHGQADLQARRLRAVDPATFGEDPLRALRAARFAAQLGFTLEPETLSLCAQQDLATLPPDRIGAEVTGLLTAQTPRAGLEALQAMGQLRAFPELDALVGCPQDPVHHPEGDVWTHTVLTVEAARALADDPGLLLAALCHDLGKPATTRPGPLGGPQWTAHGHAEAGVAPTRQLLARLGSAADRATVDRVTALVRHHLVPLLWFQAHEAGQPVGAAAFRRLSLKVNLRDLQLVSRADQLGRGPTKPDATAGDWFAARVSEIGPEPPKPLLMGRHLLGLGLPPGPSMGEILRRVYDAQLEGQVRTHEEALALAQRLR